MNATDARDLILKPVSDVANDLDILVIWQDTTSQDAPVDINNARITENWIRVKLVHTISGARSIGSSNGTRRFENNGYVYIQIFTKLGQSLSEAYTIGDALKAKFNTIGVVSGVSFYNATFTEEEPEDSYYRCKFVVNFNYEEIS